MVSSAAKAPTFYLRGLTQRTSLDETPPGMQNCAYRGGEVQAACRMTETSRPVASELEGPNATGRADQVSAGSSRSTLRSFQDWKA